MAVKKAMVLWLKLDAEKAEARAAAAKQQVRSAKATLKRARPAAKQPAPKKVRVARRSRGTRKPRADSSPEYLRSAADVAKSVIDRLQSPPPALPPEPSIPAQVKPEQPV
jgi:hypothetical protein